MKRELKEMLQEFGELVSIILMDGLVVLVIGAAMSGLRYILENWIFHGRPEDLKTQFFQFIFIGSKVCLVTSAGLHMVTVIVIQMKKLFKLVQNFKN